MDMNQILYHIYPLGFCGAPRENDGRIEHRILRVLDWIPHLKKLGITAVYFGPVFESDRHGYDTRDYSRIDCRLGTNADFRTVCDALHSSGIKVILDGVFNHTGRGFAGFQDVLAKKWDSPYRDWFHINFGDTAQPDGFWYEGWEGHQELVRLNLQNPDVRRYLLEQVDRWIAEFGIDGLRLDVAYMLDRGFLRELHDHVKRDHPDFFLLGEMIGGDYNVLLNNGCDSVTNYECRKGLYSSFNSMNLFEIGYSLNRQFGRDPWCLYTGKHLVSFADNHDVDRIASVLSDERDLPLLYDLMFAMPGIPCIYYGSEWGVKGMRTRTSDTDLRPEFIHPEWNALTDHIAALAKMRTAHRVFTDGDYTQQYIRNKQLVFSRRSGSDELLFAVNIEDAAHHADFHTTEGNGTELLTGTPLDPQHGMDLAAKSAVFCLRTDH